MRLSRFDKVIIGKAKSMINARVEGPKMEGIVESREAFIQANIRPEKKPVSQKFIEWGMQKDGDFELNLGKYLGKIGEDR